MRLIDADALLEQIDIDSKDREEYGNDWLFVDTIYNAPTIEARPTLPKGGRRMTKGEAIFYIKELQKTYASMDKKVAEAIDMAIEALSTPTDGDLISRQDAIDAVNQPHGGCYTEEAKGWAVYQILSVPSARPSGDSE